jgi:SAM-dependent methyltransferase
MAQAYQAALVPALMATWGEAIVTAAQVREGMSVLDVACGTGVATRSAARRCGSRGRVVGVDVDAGMLAVAEAESMNEGLSIEYAQGSACALPSSSGSFDAVLCLQGLQYFPDQLAAIKEMRRVMRPGSMLALITWSTLQSCKGQWAMVRALERHDIDASAARKPFSLADSTELMTVAQEAGFERVTVRKEQHLARFASAASFIEAMRKGAPSTRLALEQVPPGEWASFLGEVEGLVAEWVRDSGLEFPVECNVLEAH